MGKRSKNIFCILLVMILALSCISARSIRWTWQAGDDAVQYFRYQLDGEDPEKWTVVDADTDCYQLDNAGGKAYTLYVQASYDGDTWSSSASNTSAVQPVAGLEVIEIEDDAEERADLALNRPGRISITLSAGYGTQVAESGVKAGTDVITPYKHNVKAELGLGVQATERLRIAGSAGFGMTDFMVGTEERYLFTLPLLAGLEITTPEIGSFSGFVGAYAGGYFRFWNGKLAKAGPAVQLRAGMDMRLAKHFALTFSTGTSWILENWKDGDASGISSQFYLDPVTIGLRVIF